MMISSNDIHIWYHISTLLLLCAIIEINLRKINKLEGIIEKILKFM